MQVYHWYADTYHWPPEVVRGLSIKEDYWLRMQKEAAVKAEETLAIEAAREQ